MFLKILVIHNEVIHSYRVTHRRNQGLDKNDYVCFYRFYLYSLKIKSVTDSEAFHAATELCRCYFYMWC